MVSSPKYFSMDSLVVRPANWIQWFPVCILIISAAVVSHSTVNAHSLNAGFRGFYQADERQSPVELSNQALMVKRSPPRVVCGSKLSELLALVCHGRYNTPSLNAGRRRRSINFGTLIKSQSYPSPYSRFEETEIDQGYPEEDTAYSAVHGSPPLNRQNEIVQVEGDYSEPDDVQYEPEETTQSSYQPEGIYVERRGGAGDGESVGPYTECCLKPCSVRTMATYCHPDIQRSHYSSLLSKPRN